ncbi:MAG: outer membrane beta-barrel protein [Weeksellaceae bacterium]
MIQLKKNFLFFVFTVFFGLQLQAQNTVIISGTAIDDIIDSPVEAATVYLTLKKDSTLIDYSLTDSQGNFKMEVRKTNEDVFFTISDDLVGEYQKDFSGLTENIDLGRVKLKPLINLEGVVITGAPPIRIKTDTLEFNAASFKVRPDANVESLLKELPGVEIDEEGKITVNGKEVNQILVNGKPFFDKDGKIALQNLPADIINKVQVTDTKTKKEELAKEKASSNEATINFTIDEEKNKGIMLKLLAGYGTEDRYESSLMFNYFKGKSRLSVLGSSNNINSVGFSMNEIFDNMGGGRSRSTWRGSDGSFGVNGMNFGGGNGITQSHLGGINYADSFGKDIDFNGSYFYTQSDTKNNNFSRQENLMPGRTFITESRNQTRNQSYNHTFNTSFEVKIDSTSTIWIEPKYAYNKTESSSIFDKFTVNENDDLLNDSNGNTRTETLTQNFSNDINYFKSFKNKSQLSVDFSNKNKKYQSDETTISNTYFYQTADPDDIRNQFSKQRNTEDAYDIEVEYSFMISDSLKLGVGTEYNLKNIKNLKNNLDYDAFTNDYSQENEFLTSEISSDINSINPYLSLNLQKKKLYFNLSAGANFLNQNSNGFYRGTHYELKQDEVAPFVSFNANYRFSERGSIYMNYSYDLRFATAEQLLPIEDLSNPLFIRLGNPDLNPIKEHSLYAGFNNYNFQSKSGYNIYLGGTYEENSVVDYRLIDDNFKTTATYENVEGNYMVWGGFNVNKSFSQGSHKFRLGIGLGSSHSYRQGFVDGIKYESRNYNLRPRVNFNWDLNKVVTINPSYTLNYQFSDYKNYSIDRRDNVQHTFKIETTNYWPKKFVFGNDFSYTYNSNISDGFKKDFFLWNTSLAYNFWNDKLTFKVKVYDILGENTGSKRTISETQILDYENDVLKRYVMFSLGFKLDQFGGKKKGRGGRFMVLD